MPRSSQALISDMFKNISRVREASHSTPTLQTQNNHHSTQSTLTHQTSPINTSHYKQTTLLSTRNHTTIPPSTRIPLHTTNTYQPTPPKPNMKKPRNPYKKQPKKFKAYKQQLMYLMKMTLLGLELKFAAARKVMFVFGPRTAMGSTDGINSKTLRKRCKPFNISKCNLLPIQKPT